MPNLTPETRTNLQTVLNFIEANPAVFNMSEWGYDIDFSRARTAVALGHPVAHDCGTALCIGGTAEALLFPEGSNPNWIEVGAALGLDRKECDELFFAAKSNEIGLHTLKPEDAVRHLKAILNGKKPDWRACMYQPLAWREEY